MSQTKIHFVYICNMQEYSSFPQRNRVLSFFSTRVQICLPSIFVTFDRHRYQDNFTFLIILLQEKQQCQLSDKQQLSVSVSGSESMVPNWGACALCKGYSCCWELADYCHTGIQVLCGQIWFFKRSLESRTLWEISYFLKMFIIN